MEYSILLLDDNEDILTLTKCNLEIIEHLKILPFSDPVQALCRIHLFGIPDLIITDFELPGMTGLDFLARVTKVRDDVKAIIFTGCRDGLPKGCRFPVVLKELNAYAYLIALVRSILHIPD